jgi:hypothetical protein
MMRILNMLTVLLLSTMLVNAAGKVAVPDPDPEKNLAPVYVIPNATHPELASIWTENYKTLDCYQCFQAQGKMCHDINHTSWNLTAEEKAAKVVLNQSRIDSTNPGYAVCCKPGFSGAHCATAGDTICSPAANMTDTTDAKFLNILSGGWNQQFFAYCPSTTANLCGIGNSTV